MKKIIGIILGMWSILALADPITLPIKISGIEICSNGGQIIWRNMPGTAQFNSFASQGVGTAAFLLAFETIGDYSDVLDVLAVVTKDNSSIIVTDFFGYGATTPNVTTGIVVFNKSKQAFTAARGQLSFFDSTSQCYFRGTFNKK